MDKDALFMQYDEKHPLQGQRDHHCTDLPWLVLFLLCVAGLVPVEKYAFTHGKMEKYTHFWSQGSLCGLGLTANGTIDETVVGKPFLYVCMDAQGNPELEYPVCLESCPTADNSFFTPCFDKDTMQFTEIPTYPTKPAFPPLKLCLPEAYYAMAGEMMTGALLPWLQSLTNGLVLVGLSVPMAVLVALAYFPLLHAFAGPLSQLSVVALIVCPLAPAAKCFYIVATQDGDQSWHIVAGTTCVTVSILFVFVARYMMSGMDAAIGCVEAACECIFDEPSMLLAPVVAILVRVLTAAAIFPAVQYMYYCGDVRPDPQYGNLWSGKMAEFTLKQKLFTLYLGFMKVWLMEVSHTTSQYALAHATQLWYFTPYEGDRKVKLASCGIVHGYGVCLRYHMGSMSLAALLFTYLKGARSGLSYMDGMVQSSCNCCMRCMSKCCCLITFFFEKFLVYLQSLAFMDMAISSDNFCTAAPRATVTMLQEGSAVVILHGAEFIFSIIGVALITGIPAGLTYLGCVSLYNDEDSDHYIPHPSVPTAISGLLCCLVGRSFMMVFDTVSDTLLYCFAIDEEHQTSVAARLSSVARQPSINGVLRNDSDSEEEDSETFWEWLLGTAKEAEKMAAVEVSNLAAPLLPEHYAPRRLQQLIEDHKHLVAPAQG